MTIPQPLSSEPRYQLADAIASGGMGTVYLARRIGAAGFAKVVAVKRMRPDLVKEPEFAKMFLDEARLAGRVDHVNVVHTLDVVATGQELLLVMEYVHGESLVGLLKQTRRNDARVPADIACAIVAGALHGLHAAHEARSPRGEPLEMVHRDVSPQNILVGVDGVARVVDFGVAKAAGQLHSTSEGQLRGKMRYMAPEQIRSEGVTRLVDVFAASVVLWETLVGKPLFERELDVTSLLAVLNDPIAPPSAHVPGLPPQLDAAIMRGLERDPAKRWPSALAMAEALEGIMPIARPSQVGAWVRAVAGERLAAREAMIARLEASESLGPNELKGSGPFPALVMGGGHVEDLTTMRATASPNMSGSPTTAPTRTRSFAVAIVAAIVATCAMILAVGYTARFRSTSAPPVAAPVSPTRPDVPVAPRARDAVPPIAVTELPIARPDDAISFDPEDSPVVAPAPAAPSAGSAAGRAPARSAPASRKGRPSQPSKVDCSTPFTFDKEKHKIFKVECLQ